MVICDVRSCMHKVLVINFALKEKLHVTLCVSLTVVVLCISYIYALFILMKQVFIFGDDYSHV